MKKQVVFVKTNTEKPKNCEITVLDVDAFYKISLNEKEFNLLNENEKIPIYVYLNELESEIKKLYKDKDVLIVKE